MTLQFEDIDDAVLETQQNFIGQGGFVDLQTDLQDHVAVREMWGKKKTKFTGGKDWRFELQTDHNYSAKFVGLYETDSTILSDNMISATVQPRHANSHYVYDKRLPAFQAGARAIVDLVEAKYVEMMVSFFELLEAALWGKPVDSSDAVTPFGIAYWVTKSATQGFNGGNPAGFTAGKGGIDQATYSRWANYTDQYVNISKTDLVRKMRRAHRQTKFRSPVSHKNPNVGNMSNGIYTVDTVIGRMEELLEDQNMNLGNDLNSKEGRTMFKGTHVTWAPELDSDSTDPVYMLDWLTLAVGCMDGWEKRLSKPHPVANMHNVSRVDLDVSLNMICTNLRRQAVISKAA